MVWMLLSAENVVLGDVDPADLAFYHSFDSDDLRPERIDNRDVYFNPEKPRQVEGRFGQGVFIGGDGHGRGYRISSMRHVNPQQGAITFWFRPRWQEAAPAERRYLFDIVNNSTWSIFNLQFYGPHGSLAFSHFSHAHGGWSYEPSPGFDPADRWRHIAAVWEGKHRGTLKRLYFDGELAAEAVAGGAEIGIGDSWPQLTFGGRNDADGLWAEGDFDDIAVWTRALSVEQIKLLTQRPIRELFAEALSAPPLAAATLSVSHDRLSVADGVIHEQQQLNYRLTVANLTGSPQQVRLEQELEDFYGRAVALPSHDLTLQPQQRLQLPMSVDPEGFGVFKVRWRAGACADELLTLARLPRELAERGPNPLSSFGNHVHADVHFAGLARKLGVKWTLMKDGPDSVYTNWFSAEPKRGEVRFYDDRVQVYTDHAIIAAAGVFRTPLWASSQPDGPRADAPYTHHPPQDYADFGRFMRRMAAHYRGTVDHWEIWNEPHVPIFWSGSPEQYVQLLAEGYRAVKEGNPESVVIGGGGLSLDDWKFISGCLDAGLMDHLDVLSIHGYSDATTPLGEGRMELLLQRLRQEIADRGRPEVPIWNTEHTTFSLSFLERYWPTFDSQRREFHYRPQAARLVREHVMAVAAGVERMFYYWFWPAGGFFENTPINGAMTEPSGAPKPMAVAYAVLAWMIDAARYAGEIDIDRSKRRAYLFEHQAGPLVVAWSLADGQVLSLPADVPLTVRNLMGNITERPARGQLDLTREPVYIQAPAGITADALARLFQTQDYTETTSGSSH